MAKVCFTNGQHIPLPRVTLDTGADSGNYIGRSFAKLTGLPFIPCQHTARLGDGKTILKVDSSICLEVAMQLPDGSFHAPINTSFYIVDSLGNEAIIGLPSLLGDYFEYFWDILQSARGSVTSDELTKEIQRLVLDLKTEL